MMSDTQIKWEIDNYHLAFLAQHFLEKKKLLLLYSLISTYSGHYKLHIRVKRTKIQGQSLYVIHAGLSRTHEKKVLRVVESSLGMA